MSLNFTFSLQIVFACRTIKPIPCCREQIVHGWVVRTVQFGWKPKLKRLIGVQLRMCYKTLTRISKSDRTAAGTENEMQTSWAWMAITCEIAVDFSNYILLSKAVKCIKVIGLLQKCLPLKMQCMVRKLYIVQYSIFNFHFFRSLCVEFLQCIAHHSWFTAQLSIYTNRVVGTRTIVIRYMLTVWDVVV